MAGVPFKVKAVYEYTSQEPDDLNFPLGQIITVTEEIDADWYEGEFTDVTGVKKAGIFPNNFVEKYEPEVPSRPTRPTRAPKEEPVAPTPAVEDVPEPVSAPAPSIPAATKPVASATASPVILANEPAPTPITSPKVQQTEAPTAEKKAPPVAPKSNAFKDRIAAFNAPAAAPILPFQPGSRNQPAGGFIKKPFVAPPPSKDAYVPAPKQETVVKPYLREEDPEIRQRQEEDRAAAQAAGLTNDGDEEDAGEDAPKPQSLKDRIAMLQKQQAEQAQRRAEGAPKKERKLPPPPKKASQTSQPEADDEDADDEDARLSRVRSPEGIDDVADDTQRTRLPSAQRRAPELPSVPPVPQHEILSGGEEADHSAQEETTDDAGTIGPDDADSPVKGRPAIATHPDEEAEGDAGEDEEEDEMDEETRRKLELRERMAKMSGGMGMPGMFSPMMAMPGALPPKKKTAPRERQSTEDSVASSPPIPQQRMPMIPVPGMPRASSPGQLDQSDDRRQSLSADRGAPPPPPADRPRPIPTLATGGTQGYESDDEEPLNSPPADTPGAETPLPIRSAAPPVPQRAQAEDSYFGENAAQPRRSTSIANDSSVTSPRPPPPPPPTADGPPPRPVPAADERGESEYEGDYDTDIASSAKRKDALKSHVREPSLDDSTTADEGPAEPAAALEYSRAPPPPPTSSRPRQSAEIPRAPPPRPSADLPRAPPPIPPPRDTAPPADDDDYDPYRYQQELRSPPPVPDARPIAAPPIPPPREGQENNDDSSDDLYSAPAPPRRSVERQLPPPPPPPTEASTPAPPPRNPPRKSMEAPARGRASLELAPGTEKSGQIAKDLDLAESSQWWTGTDPLPPVLQDRRGVDILSESEESTTSKRGGRTTISKDIYVLFLDYSQTVITARYDSREPADVSLEQRHEPPPAKLRQDQLESTWQRFGAKIAETANGLGSSKKETSVGDGSSASFVLELIKSLPDALLPVGNRAYGAPVYANLANASVMQWDEIRPGDIVTLRNAKLEGKHSGGLHQKYKQETGSLHAAIVHEWDGTKKKIRVWEQGRDKKSGLHSESYRLGDLKSGEVRVWRVVGRDWVGWDSNA